MIAPATLSLILQGILAAISAAPKVAEVVTAGKNLISTLFAAKLIDQATQDALHAYVDTHAKLASMGIIPPGWQVDPDPVA